MKTELNRVGKLCDKFRFYYILDDKKKRPDVHGFALLHCADFVTFDKGSKQDKSPGLYCSNSLMVNSYLAGKNRHNRNQGHCRSIESQLNCRVTTIVVAMTPVTVVESRSICLSTMC